MLRGPQITHAANGEANREQAVVPLHNRSHYLLQVMARPSSSTDQRDCQFKLTIVQYCLGAHQQNSPTTWPIKSLGKIHGSLQPNESLVTLDRLLWYWYVPYVFEEGDIVTNWIPGTKSLTGFFTKNLFSPQFGDISKVFMKEGEHTPESGSGKCYRSTVNHTQV